jgi:hypothetical protein
MKSSVKKKVNLTIDQQIVELAHRVAEERGRSLSSLVEDFLSMLVADSKHISADSEQADWVSSFHRKYLPKNFKDPSDEKINALKKNLLDKYQ